MPGQDGIDDDIAAFADKPDAFVPRALTLAPRGPVIHRVCRRRVTVTDRFVSGDLWGFECGDHDVQLLSELADTPRSGLHECAHIKTRSRFQSFPIHFQSTRPGLNLDNINRLDSECGLRHFSAEPIKHPLRLVSRERL